jgi:Flp pilus assembly protein TadG
MSKVAGAVFDWINRVRRDRAGNVTIIFALTLIPMMGAVGVGVDFSRASRIRTVLIAAADAASVGAIAKSSKAYIAASTMSGNGSISTGVTDAGNIFNAQMQNRTGYSNLAVNSTVSKTGLTVTSNVAFTASVASDFMGIFGIKTINLAGSSTAANNLPIYMDFYLLLDNTPSMGVGATPADVATMVNNTPDQCAFACHIAGSTTDYYSLAKTLGVTMRIDVLRTATQQLMDTAKATETYSNQFRMAIYTFGSSATNTGMTTIAALTSNLANAKTQANAIDLMTVPYQNYADDTDTNYHAVLPAMNTAIPDPGDGSSSSSPQKWLFFVSDGVADEVNPSGPGCSRPTVTGSDPQTSKNYVRCQAPLDASLCTTIKNRGIGVLYTTYLPLPTNQWYTNWIAPFNPTVTPPAQTQIEANMQSCATPGFYFEVSPTQGISDAMNALFQKAVATARLTR